MEVTPVQLLRSRQRRSIPHDLPDAITRQRSSMEQPGPASAHPESRLPADSLVALVPLRSIGEGSKTRLRDSLSSADRAELVTAMFADVIGALECSGVPRIVVVAGHPSASELARSFDLEVSCDPPGSEGLNAAVAAATDRLPPHRDVLVVMPDLPMLTSRDIDALVSIPAAVVIAPTHDGGTGGLLRRSGSRSLTRFGRGSAGLHHREALASGAEAAWCRLPGFWHDIDRVADLATVAHDGLGTATAKVGALFEPRRREETLRAGS